jgi:hypothetical protein
MIDEPASDQPSPPPEPAPDPPEDSSPFDLPPMDVVTRNDQPENLETRDGD